MKNEKLNTLIILAKGEDRNLSQLAMYTGLTQGAISLILHGKRKPSPETLKKIADKAKNDVTYEMLMQAAGYLEDTNDIPPTCQPMETLKELRKSKKLKQKDVALDLNISVQSYCNYETGQRRPDPDMLKKLAEYYDTSVDYLLERTDSPNPNANIAVPQSLSGIPIAFHGGVEGISQEGLDDIAEFIEYVKAKEQKKNR